MRRPDQARHQQRLTRRQEERHKRDLEDFRWLLSEVRGRRVLWALLHRTGLYSGTFDGTSRTYHLEGRRSVGIELRQLAQQLDPVAYSQMVGEQTDELAEEQARDRAAATPAQKDDDE